MTVKDDVLSTSGDRFETTLPLADGAVGFSLLPERTRTRVRCSQAEQKTCQGVTGRPQRVKRGSVGVPDGRWMPQSETHKMWA